MIAILLGGWLLTALLTTYGNYAYWRAVANPLDAPHGEGIAVIIPIKGVHGQGDALHDFLAGCGRQSGASYRLIIAVENEDDPAFPAIETLAFKDARVSLVVAGRADHRGQKVHNQLAALATLRPEDRIIVFADADVIWPPDWLKRLTRPVLTGYAHLSSGYRWFIPADSHLASRFCALADWGIATAPRSRRWNLCWGGAMAVSRTLADQLDLPRLWDRSAVDDIVLSSAARRLGHFVHAPLQSLTPSLVSHNWVSLLEFGRRQYLFVRVHAPKHWLFSGFILGFPVVCCAICLHGIGQGNILALCVFGAVICLQQIRAQFRGGIARRVLPEQYAQVVTSIICRDRWVLPLVHLLHLTIWITSAFGRSMTWSGVDYHLTDAAHVKVIGRR